MEWNVLYYNFNAKQIQPYNVLAYRDDKIKKLKKQSGSIEAFSEELRLEMMYYFWSKCEWEIIVKSLGWCKDGSDEKRVDAYDQLRLNWDRFVEYCWNNC